MKRMLVILAAGVFIFLGGCQTATFGTYGPDAAWTTVDAKAVDRAVSRTYTKLAHWIDNADGTRSCPSMHAASTTHSVGKTPDAEARQTCSRTEVSFDDPDGKHIKIETISTSGNPTLIFVTHDDPDASPMVMRELHAELEAEEAHPN